MMDYHTYIDWTLEAVPRVYYVGKGTSKRVRNPERNVKHKNIRNVYGLRREIVFTSADQEQCLTREIQLVAEHHTYVGDPLASEIACNFTTGGEKCHMSEETKRKIGESTRNSPYAEERRRKISETMKGRVRTQEHSQNISAGKRGKPSGWEGRKQTPEHIAARVEAFKRNGKKKGQAPWNKGKKVKTD